MKDSQLNALLAPIVARFGLELEDVMVRPAGKRRLVRVTVDGDGPQGRGPSLDDIADATKAVSTVLDESSAAGDSPYTLEVSSRGIGRPLTAARHWRRNRGRLVTVSLTDGSVATGRITAADDDGFDLDVDQTPRRVGYDQVAKAIVQVEFNRPRADGDADVNEDEATEEEV